MTFIPEDIVKEIEEKATLHNILKQYHNLSKKRGSQIVIDCPSCGKKEKLEYSEKKGIAKCFSCDTSAKTPVSYLMNFQGKSYREALEELAKLEGIEIISKKSAKKKPRRTLKTATESYRDKMLKNSGLTIQDITDEIYVDEHTKKNIPLYSSGTFDERNEITSGDDVIIHYYDLEGKPMTYYRKNRSGNATGTKKEFKRVRYQNPKLHKDRNGNNIKYRSPYGSGTKVYINKYIRRKYKAGSRIETLYIQEGEKKADKATKHGLVSVGVMGIHNIAHNKTLPKEFELIIKKCQVENVVFVLDEDWQNLSSKIDSKNAADNRPKSFFRAVVNFRDHFYAFTNNDIDLRIFFAYVKSNKKGDKGIDDLLTNTLKGKEDTLKSMCEAAIKTPDGNAIHLQFEKITTVSEYKLKEHWGLQSKEAFFNKHRTVLSQLRTPFKFGGVKYRFNDKKEFELAQPILDHEKYWNKNLKKNAEGEIIGATYTFNYKRCYTFLQNRGFYRFKQPNNKYIFVQLEDNIAQEVETHQIKDFIKKFSANLNEEEIENMLFRQGSRYFGQDSLSNLDYKDLEIHQADKGIQYMYFQNECWKITKDGIENEKLKHLSGHIWKNQIKDFEPSKVDLFSELQQITDEHIEADPSLKDFKGEWTLAFTKAGMNCHFLQFLLNTSDMYHDNRTRPIDKYNQSEKFETSKNLLSKLSAFGYLLHNYKDSSVLKAVIGMDALMTEVGLSNGRSGKSLLGMGLEKLNQVVYITGKRKDLLDDKYIFDEVNDRTNNVWIDDVRLNFDLEYLFPHITGKFIAEQKGMGKVSYNHSLKMYITTNHALKGNTSSYKDRQVLLGFSDWYNDKHKPIDDFGMNFWDEEWPLEQWNYFYNLAAFCLHIYFKHGLINAPTEKLEKRRLRQEIGENILAWAEEYFSNPNNFNTEILKHDLYTGNTMENGEGYLVKYPNDRKYVSPTQFKRKLKALCNFKNWEYNFSKQGADIKKGGKEYIEFGVSEEHMRILTESQILNANV
jgi:hypothetical protein